MGTPGYWGGGPDQGDYRTVDPGATNYLVGGSATAPSDWKQWQPNDGAIQHNAAMGMNQPAPQIDPSQQAQFRAMQLAQAQQLQGVASGQQAGAGELAIQRQVANAQAAQQAQAMASRGQNTGLAQMQAARQQASIGLSGAGQSQQAALSDQQAAQSQLANSLNQGRSGDMSLAQGNANLQAGQNQLAQGYNQQLVTEGGQELQGANSNWQAAQQDHGIIGGLFNTGGAMMAASDENLKTDISDADGDIDEMLNNLVAKTYRYKDEKKYGTGPRAGIMAQDLQKSKAGKALVVDLPNGDGIGFDVSKAVSALLAATARLNQRTRKLEGTRG